MDVVRWRIVGERPGLQDFCCLLIVCAGKILRRDAQQHQSRHPDYQSTGYPAFIFAVAAYGLFDKLKCEDGQNKGKQDAQHALIRFRVFAFDNRQI